MAMALKKFMDRMGVMHILHAYETCPWAYYDEDDKITADAAVAMNADADELTAELMFIHDEPESGKHPVEMLFAITLIPHKDEDWKLTTLKIRGEDKKSETYDVENNSCDVFRECKAAIARQEIPDFDAILRKELNKGGSGNRKGGGGGKRNPNIRPEQMPGMSRGKV